MRRDGVYLRICVGCRPDECNPVMHLVVILADQLAKHPGFFRRNVEALHLPNKVAHEGVASSRSQIYKNHDRVWRVPGLWSDDNRAVTQYIMASRETEIRAAFEIILLVIDAVKAVYHSRAFRMGIDPAFSCFAFQHWHAMQVVKATDVIPMRVGGYDAGKIAGLDAAGRKLIHDRNQLVVRGSLHRRDQQHVRIDLPAKAGINKQIALGMADEHGRRRQVSGVTP